MKSKNHKIPPAAFIILLLVSTLQLSAQQRLVAVGGGKRPPEVMKRFVEWGGGTKANILVITWATSEPEASFAGLKDDFAKYGPAAIIHATDGPLNSAKRSQFVEQLKAATGVFFSGGDQNRIMDILADDGLLQMLREKYNSGTPFGGTSAGSAALSDPMMTGDADLKTLDGKKVGVRKGLGLIPGVILDQHFLVRQRHNRLFGLMMVNPSMLGIGINEDMALAVVDNRDAEIVGPTQVMFIDPHGRNNAFLVYILSAGQHFDLKKRRPRKGK